MPINQTLSIVALNTTKRYACLLKQVEIHQCKMRYEPGGMNLFYEIDIMFYSKKVSSRIVQLDVIDNNFSVMHAMFFCKLTPERGRRKESIRASQGEDLVPY